MLEGHAADGAAEAACTVEGDTRGAPSACHNAGPPTPQARHKATSVTGLRRSTALAQQLKDGSRNLNVSRAFEGITKIGHGKMDLGSNGIDFKVSLS